MSQRLSQKPFDFLPAHLVGMGGPVEFDEPDNPVYVRTLGAKGVVMQTQELVNFIHDSSVKT